MLSPKAEQKIEEFLNLPFDGVQGVRCPYFNNAHVNRRGQLRGLIGRGSPKEIAEEARILSIQYHKDIFDHSGHCHLNGQTNEAAAECVRRFLIDNNLGIDCAGFISHILISHFKEMNNFNLSRHFNFENKNFFRRLINRLRPVENMSVQTYGQNSNTILIADGRKNIDWKTIAPADLIIMMATGPKLNRNHILLITGNDGQTIKYVHSRAWSSEGQYGHGVTRGEIIINNPAGSLLEQQWLEKSQTGTANETFLEAKTAKTLEIRRVKI